MKLSHMSAVLLLAACETPRPPPLPTGGTLNYHLPSFNLRLSAPNFEYVKFGVTGSADMQEVLGEMYGRKQAGLVNKALRALYAQVPMTGGAFGLVNVVTDVSSVRSFSSIVQGDAVTDAANALLKRGPAVGAQTQEQDLGAQPDSLAIRADVVRFTEVIDKDYAEALPGVGIYRLDKDGKAALEARVARILERGAIDSPVLAFRDKP